MSKAILIVDNPKNCAECKVVDYWPKVQEYHCRYLENRYLKKYDEKPIDCPLRPIPDKEAIAYIANGEVIFIDPPKIDDFPIKEEK